MRTEPCRYGSCDGTGWIEVEETNGARECECRRERVAAARAARLATSIPRRYLEVDFERWPITNLDQRIVREAPKETHPGLIGFSRSELRDLADALKVLLVRYDNLWQMPFPYVMTLHHAPIRAMDNTFHFHIEFHPPLRKPHLLKYLAGPEIGGGNFLGDTLPEEKAAELRSAGNVHYKLT
jgi:hypothetical protein